MRIVSPTTSASIICCIKSMLTKISVRGTRLYLFSIQYKHNKRPTMENPHAEAESALLARIINNMENLNDSVTTVNKYIHDINKQNLDIEVIAAMWDSYLRNADFNLEATGLKYPPVNTEG